MNKVINLHKKIEEDLPNDLMTISELGRKHHIPYSTIYKYSRICEEIPYYDLGALKISDNDLKIWIKKRRVAARG